MKQSGVHILRRGALSKWAMLLVLFLAISLRLTGLGAKSLWQDEIFTAAIASTMNGISEVVTIPLYNTALPAPPLYFIITHFFLHIGDSDFLLRFPALFFGVLGVSMTYALGARLFGRAAGLGGGFLLAISPLHIRYSQDARFYSLLAFLSLLSLYFLCKALSGGKSRAWIGFIACSVANLYNHLFALLVVLAEIVFAAGLWVKNSLIPRWRHGGKGRIATQPQENGGVLGTWKSFAFPVSLATIIALYAPMIPHLLRGLAGSKGLGGETTPGVSLTPSFLAQLLEGWGAGPGLALFVYLIPFLAGVAACVRSHRRQLWLASCWLAVPFAVLLAVPARHGFRPRYVIFMLPVYLVFIAKGLMTVNGMVDDWLEGRGVQRSGIVFAISMVVFTLVSFPALEGYYGEARSDWKAVAALLESSFSDGQVIVSPGPFPQVVLPRYFEDLEGASFLMGGSEYFLSPERESQEGVWFIGPGRERMNLIEEELRAATPLLFKVVFEVDTESASQAIRLSIAPTMYSDLWVLYVRDGLDVEEMIDRYEEALEVVSPTVASSIHTTLGGLLEEREALDEAETHYRQAIALNSKAPEPHRRLAELYDNRGLEEEATVEWEIYGRLTDER